MDRKVKYIVVSCGEREMHLEAAFDTYSEAYAKMKSCFIEYHKGRGCDDDDIAELTREIDACSNIENANYGFYDRYAWSNVFDDYNYDLKIFEIV